MKSYVLIAAALLASTAALAEASKKPVSKWTCEEFLAVEGDFQHRLRLHSHEAVNDLATLEDHQGGDTLHAVSGGDI